MHWILVIQVKSGLIRQGVLYRQVHYICMQFSLSCIPDDNKSTSLEQLNTKRVALVRDTCDIYRNSKTVKNLSPTTYYYLIADDTHRVVYCYVPKVACSSLKYLMENTTSKRPIKMNLGVHDPNLMRSAGLIQMSDIKNATERQYKLEHYKTILVVRNPFERLYSAYVDKFINAYGDYGTFKPYRDVTKKLFPDIKPTNGGLFITFEQFLKMVILAKTTDLDYLAVPRRDQHWKTINQLCSPCQVRYDFILKLHMLNHEKELILPLFNATDLPHMNTATSHKKNVFKVTIPDIMTAYRNVTLDLLQQINITYRQDLEMFDYGFDIETGMVN